ncbi:unnamed protein product, partial [Mesorhabditis belari]|uniref:DUF7622 domain-containing protein n=1 Tax=Mesorhabditis belari TaxID=2138241 RepID=A0AAF3EGY5_9BILA
MKSLQKLFLVYCFFKVNESIRCDLRLDWRPRDFGKTTIIYNQRAVNCTGEMCYVFRDTGANRTAYGCIHGMKYWNISDGCYVDPISFMPSLTEPNPSSTYACLCSVDDCNKKLPVLDIQIKKATWSNETYPVTIREPYRVQCHSFLNNVTLDQNGDLPLLTAANFTTFMAPMCHSEYWLLQNDYVETNDFQRARLFIDGAWRKQTDALFQIWELHTQILWFYNDGNGYGRPHELPTYNGLVYAVQPGKTLKVYRIFCDWDFCNTINITNMAPSLVKCQMMDGNTCMGHMCYWVVPGERRGSHSYEPETQGCFVQDDSRASGRLEVGKYLYGSEFRFCDEDMCNVNLERMDKSIKKRAQNSTHFTPYTGSSPTYASFTLIFLLFSVKYSIVNQEL